MNLEKDSKRKQERLRRRMERKHRARATETAEEREVRLARRRERYRECKSEGIRPETVLAARWQSGVRPFHTESEVSYN